MARSNPVARAAGAAQRRIFQRGPGSRSVPRGWSTGPPDFVGVGAQRAGTKWWYGLVCDHPQVHPASGKELHFFDRYSGLPFGDADVGEYHGLFPRPAGSITGEWTPRYMYDPWTPALLSRAAPDVKVLVQLRDPWDRFASGVTHETRVLKRELRGGRGDYLRAMIAHDALRRSLYAPQVARLLERFQPSRVLVLQYERCVSDPERELRRTYDFLGVEDAGHIPDFLTRRTGRSSARPQIGQELECEARRLFQLDLEALAQLVDDVDLGLWPSRSAG